MDSTTKAQWSHHISLTTLDRNHSWQANLTCRRCGGHLGTVGWEKWDKKGHTHRRSPFGLPPAENKHKSSFVFLQKQTNTLGTMEEDLDEGQTQKGRKGFLCKLLQRFACFYHLFSRNQSDVATWQFGRDHCPNATFPSPVPWREKKGAAAVWSFNAFVQRARLSVAFWPSEGRELIRRGAERLCLPGVKAFMFVMTTVRENTLRKGSRAAPLHTYPIHQPSDERPQSSDTQICLPAISVKKYMFRDGFLFLSFLSEGQLRASYLYFHKRETSRELCVVVFHPPAAAQFEAKALHHFLHLPFCCCHTVTGADLWFLFLPYLCPPEPHTQAKQLPWHRFKCSLSFLLAPFCWWHFSHW